MEQSKREYIREWRRNHPEKCYEYHQRYYEQNADKVSAKSRDYYYKNKERVKETIRKYKERDPEGWKIKRKKYEENVKAKKDSLKPQWPVNLLTEIYGSIQYNKNLENMTDQEFENWLIISMWANPKEKDILFLRYKDKKKLREIAEIFGCSQQWISIYIGKCLNKMRDIAEGYR